MFSVENLINIFNQYREFAFLISLLFSILIALSGVLPSIFVTGANIIFFGPINGFIISILGEVIGGYITFKVYRLGLRPANNKIRGHFKIVDKLLDSEGTKAGFLIFEGRLIPFIPSGFVTLASALSNVKDKTFIIYTFLGKIPSIALETLISYDVINIQENYIRLGITLLALILGILFKKIFVNKK